MAIPGVGYFGNFSRTNQPQMRKHAVRFFLCCILCSFLVSTQAQHATATSFPQAFVGHWKGQLNWQRGGAAIQTFPMQLIIKAVSDSNYTWQIIYGDQQQDNRPYILKPVKPAVGHWQVDEQNGIILDSYVFDHSFTGAFTVQGNTIVDKYTVRGDSMDVEFLSIQLDKKTRSGTGTEESPFVDSYRIGSLQWGTLIKQKP